MTIEEFVTGSAFPNVASIADNDRHTITWLSREHSNAFTVHPKKEDESRLVEAVWTTRDAETGGYISIKGKIFSIAPDMSITELKVDKYPPDDEQTQYVSLRDFFKDER